MYKYKPYTYTRTPYVYRYTCIDNTCKDKCTRRVRNKRERESKSKNLRGFSFLCFRVRAQIGMYRGGRYRRRVDVRQFIRGRVSLRHGKHEPRATMSIEPRNVRTVRKSATRRGFDASRVDRSSLEPRITRPIRSFRIARVINPLRTKTFRTVRTLGDKKTVHRSFTIRVIQFVIATFDSRYVLEGLNEFLFSLLSSTPCSTSIRKCELFPARNIEGERIRSGRPRKIGRAHV